MRLLCVARHEFLSDHLCRYFGAVGVQCEKAVGIEGARAAARNFEPHLVVAESELLGPAVLEAWSNEDSLHDVPVLAVSLTRRPEECPPADLCGVAGVIYLPTLDRSAALALLDGARKPRGVGVPADASIVARLTTPAH
jgi:hypothetical protein